MSSVADFENLLAMDQPIHSSVVPRWQRKSEAKSSSTDRFIPNRAACDMEHSFENTSTDNSQETDCDHSRIMEEEMMGHGPSRVLAFKQKAPAPKDGYQSSLKVLYSQTKKAVTVKPVRHIPSAPVRVLDAPDFLDDYYLNLLSWGSNNQLAVALSRTVYIWDAATGNIRELLTLDSESAQNNHVGSVSWIQEGNHLAVGTAENTVQLWDCEAGKQIRKLNGHAGRVSSLAWNSYVLSSGSRDNTIINHDVRIREHAIATLRGHTQEVCGLSWSPDGTTLASGGNDNTLCIWDCNIGSSGSLTPKHVLTEHQAAVKALAWSPHERNLLASGGGTADRHIRFWNTATGTQMNSIDTGSQVCALQWSPVEKEILSSHGYAENQLCLWKYPTMAKMKELKGHTARVLHMVTSPDGSMVCTGAADETLRFWNVFGSDSKKSKDTNITTGLQRSASSLRIR